MLVGSQYQLLPVLRDEEYQALKADIEKRGVLVPVELDENGNILDGHHRVAIARELGVSYQTIERRFDSEQDKQEHVLKINLLRRHMGPISWSQAFRRLAEIKDSTLGSKGGPAANRSTVEQLASELGVKRQTAYYRLALEEDLATEPDLAEKVDAGEMGAKDARREKRKRTREDRKIAEVANLQNQAVIIEEDAMVWLDELPQYDLLLTDPPYSTDVEDIEVFASAWLSRALAKMKTTGRAFVCIGAYPRELLAYLNTALPDQVLVWTYENTLGPVPKYDYKLNWQAILYFQGKDAEPLDCLEMLEQFTVQRISAPDGRQGDRYHTWQKPLQLGERFIRHATKQGDLVVDPFAGTGTFLLAAAKLGRQAIGCEIDPEMIAIARERGCS